MTYQKMTTEYLIKLEEEKSYQLEKILRKKSEKKQLKSDTKAIQDELSEREYTSPMSFFRSTDNTKYDHVTRTYIDDITYIDVDVMPLDYLEYLGEEISKQSREAFSIATYLREQAYSQEQEAETISAKLLMIEREIDSRS